MASNITQTEFLNTYYRINKSPGIKAFKGAPDVTIEGKSIAEIDSFFGCSVTVDPDLKDGEWKFYEV